MKEAHLRDPRPRQILLRDLLALGQPAIDAALREDAANGDPTSDSAVSPSLMGRAFIRAKALGVIAGLPVAESVFRAVNPVLRFTPCAEEGAWVVPGERVAEVCGLIRSILLGERTALNFLQRMSGIATITAWFVEALSHTEAVLLDTRRIAPGLRALDKYAVRIGGGSNHRLALSDLALVKENHIRASGGIAAALGRVRTAHPSLPIEVEVRSLEKLSEALAIDPPLERILLDNLSPGEIARAVRETRGRAILEASGGIGLGTAVQVARTGVDTLSVGVLTHSPKALDLSLLLQDPGKEDPAEAILRETERLRRRLGEHQARFLRTQPRAPASPWRGCSPCEAASLFSALVPHQAKSEAPRLDASRTVFCRPVSPLSMLLPIRVGALFLGGSS